MKVKQGYILFISLLISNIVSYAQIPDSIKIQLDWVIQQGLHLYNKKPDTAKIIVKEAYHLAMKNNYYNEAAELLRIQGLVAFNKVDYVKALNFYTRSKEIFHDQNNPQGEASAQNNIATVYSSQGLYRKSMKMDQKTLYIRMGLGDSTKIAGSYNNIAVSQQNLGMFSEALKNYFNALSITTTINDSSSLGLYYNNIGNIYLKTNQLDSAKYYFLKSRAICHQLGNLQIESNALAYLGELYNKLGDYKKAIAYLEQSLKIAYDIQITFEIESVAKELHLSYAHIGDYKKAYKYHLLYKQMADSANNKETIQRISQIETASEYEQELLLQKLLQEKQRIETKLEVARHKQHRNLAYFIIIAFIFLAIALYRIYRIKARDNELLIQQKEEILAQKEEIETQRDKIKALNDTKDKFFAIIGHDLRNPLGGVNQIADITYSKFDDYKPEKIKKNLKLIKISSEKAYGLLQNLLSWAMVQLGSINPDIQYLNITHLIKYNIGLLKASADHNMLNISFNEEKEFYAMVDKDIFNTVIRNILINAIKFTPRNGNILIELSASNNNLIVSIQDNGIGISLTDQKKLFDPNSDPKTIGTSKEKGTGLGLNLCKEFIERLSGKIWVESELNVGSVFYISVPMNKK